jgi:hypothetical protein
MSVPDVDWTPTEGGAARDVPTCASCGHQVDDGIQPDMWTCPGFPDAAYLLGLLLLTVIVCLASYSIGLR